ncbi:hypothetical protein AB205_0029880, partial [Aquarana catesbeiana]
LDVESDEDNKNEIYSGEEDSEMSDVDLNNEEDEESEEDDEEDDSRGDDSEEDDASSGEEEDSDSGPDLARGKGNIETSSEDEDDDDDMADTANKDTEIEHDWREMDKDAPRGDQAEMALLIMDDVEDDRKHFNYDKIVEQQNLSRSKKKRLKKKEELVEDNFQINVDDSRFHAMYTSHLYNLDPSDPNFKKTKAMERVLEEKARRREQEQKDHTETVKTHWTELETVPKTGTSSAKTDPSLSLLLKSVKSKTQQFQASRKKQKTK